MAEAQKKASWFKTVLGTAAGLCSGAVVMWFSPLLDKVIKPSKPVANFAVEHSGLTVTFHNRSVNGGQGRWDFGDGSPLEFVAGDQPTITHTYGKQGNYTAKFTLTNLLGEENERSVTVELTPDSSKPLPKPAIVDLYARPPGKVGQAVYAPATFQFETTADDAQLYVWDYGDGSGIQMGEHQSNHTFAKAGTYTITVVAFNGKQKSQRDVTVDVYDPPAGMLQISLKVADQGTQVETRQRDAAASQALTLSGKNNPPTIEQTLRASAGFEITEVKRLRSQNRNVEKTQWQIASDKKSVKITGQVVKVSGASSAVLNEHFTITEQRKAKASRDPVPVASMMSAPGTATLLLPPVPDNWTDVQRQFTFELRQDNQVLWQGAQLPVNIPVTLNGRSFSLAATPKGERVQIELQNRVAAK